MTQRFYSHGKLLITGEYAVLDSALSLAIPTTYGQSLSVTKINSGHLTWKSYDEKGNLWFESILTFEELSSRKKPVRKNPVEDSLLKILRDARKYNPRFLATTSGYSVETTLEFPPSWGLGSSSTLINNIALWADVDPYKLLWNSFGGSGYDIACARHTKPILYELKKPRPVVKEIDFRPPFSKQVYFVHLGKKQNSREGISHYRNMDFDVRKLVSEITRITKQILQCTTLSNFEILLEEHEHILSKTLHLPTVRETLFPDYNGLVKSLGAWGGDFVMVTGNGEFIRDYFKNKGYHTIVPFDEMVL
ncbi:GYDIA family GHMP kinase [Pareuzebyella sediminis]|uniref:GYDIA family GHMP kinase n=1 Tax=Pareuzebyella sediminis TaxID=2607998 RepID=UPI0011EEE86F|nr:GYDIA family GHMP kinase [Pareuzebyella sediminis]